MVYVPQVYVPGQDDSANNTQSTAPTPAPAAPTVVQAVAYNPSAPSAPTAPQYSAPPSQQSHVPQGVHHSTPSVPTAPNQYAPYSAAASAPPAQHASPAPAPTPDFSLALDVPPPAIPSTASASTTSYSTTKPHNSQVNNSFVVQGTPIAGPSSSVFNGTGPTGSVISEGNPVKCHKVDYEIKGHDMQLVEVELDPGETVIAEAGAMMFLEDDVDFKAKLGDGSNPNQKFFGKLFSAAGRILTGESLFITHFTNRAHHGKKRVAFAAPYPGTVIPVNMGAIGEKLICQKDAFLCAAFGTKVALHFNKRLGSGLFGGEGFILQRLEGDGMAFIHAGGTVIKRELRGDRLRIDTGCVVAFTGGINFDVKFAPGLKTVLFGGEGLFLATLQGYGTVWIQSLPFSRLADRILANAPSAGGRRTGEGSYLTGNFGDLIDGDGFQGWG